MGRPLLGVGHTVSLQSLSAQGVVLLGRLVAVESGERLSFAADLEENIRFGDEASAQFKRHIDDYIVRVAINAPAAEDDPDETVTPRLPDPPIRSLDPAERSISTVIWCTGFDGDFGWVKVPGALDAQGQPVHEEGISIQPGLCFAGMDFAVTRKSGTLLSLAEEGPRLISRLVAHH
jgi:putative flavoprotein involved in K+ transport